MNRRLEQFLAAENISQAQFADTIEVARASVSHILAGRNKPGYDFIASMLSHYPSLNADWLLTGRGKMYKESPKNEIQPSQEIDDVQPDLFTEVSNPEPNKVEASEKVSSPQSSPETNISSHIDDTAEKSNSHEGRKISRIIVFFDDNTYQEIH